MSAHPFHFDKIFFVFFAICGLHVVAAQQEFAIEPAPKWATSIEVKEYNNPLEKKADSGIFCLLFDVEINGGTKERFVHYANKFVTSSGVAANSRLSFDFDPSYQQLVFHGIVIHRGNEVLDQLDLSKVRLIQQEKELDRQVYNGAKTAFLFLEDVRVGDWIECSYTIRGRNPVEDGHFFDVLQLRWPLPIQKENYRLLWPQTNRPLWVQVSGNTPKNRKVTEDSYEYYWHWEDRPGQEIEDYVPLTVVKYDLAHFSDFRTWTEVADWAGKSFQPETVSHELYQKTAAWRDAKTIPEERVVKALQFVQDEIRYLGIENGVNSHQATDPSIVFARGYGDCKDKALLFCTILRFFDVDASPILVSTGFRDNVKGFIPTPVVFDHVIVQVILNGKTNYVDPTRSFQRGLLDQRFIDRFGHGLPLEDNSPGLVTLLPTTTGLPHTIINENFDVSTNGAAELIVTNTYEGRDADFMRQALASLSQDSLDKNCLAYYQKYYGNVAASKGVEILDDEQSNRIHIIERYSISNIWKPAAQTNFITCEFASPEIMSRLIVPEKRERKLPLAVSCPQDFTHRIRIETHEPWRIVPEEKKIRTRAFAFFGRTTCNNNTVTVTSDLLTTAYQISPADMPEYLAALDQIPHFLGISVTKPLPGRDMDGSLNWSIWMAAIFYSLILLAAATVVYRYKPKSSQEILPTMDPKLKGLGGWLAVLGLSLMAAILVDVSYLIKTSHAYSIQKWSAYTDPANAAYDTLMAPLLLYELFVRLTTLCFKILLVIFYFQKRRVFPKLVIVYLLFQFLTISFDQAMALGLKSHRVTTNAQKKVTSPIGLTCIPLIIWSLYLTRSKRVKLTFRDPIDNENDSSIILSLENNEVVAETCGYCGFKNEKILPNCPGCGTRLSSAPLEDESEPTLRASRLLEDAARLENIDRNQAVMAYKNIVSLYPNTHASKEAIQKIEALNRHL